MLFEQLYIRQTNWLHFLLIRFAMSQWKILLRPIMKNLKIFEWSEVCKNIPHLKWWKIFLIHETKPGTYIARPFCSWLKLFYQIFLSGKARSASQLNEKRINYEHTCQILHPQIKDIYLPLYLSKLVSSELFTLKSVPEKRILQSFFENQSINYVSLLYTFSISCYFVFMVVILASGVR